MVDDPLFGFSFKLLSITRLPVGDRWWLGEVCFGRNFGDRLPLALDDVVIKLPNPESVSVVE